MSGKAHRYKLFWNDRVYEYLPVQTEDATAVLLYPDQKKVGQFTEAGQLRSTRLMLVWVPVDLPPESPGPDPDTASTGVESAAQPNRGRRTQRLSAPERHGLTRCSECVFMVLNCNKISMEEEKARARARYAEWIREHLAELGPEKDVIDLHYEVRGDVAWAQRMVKRQDQGPSRDFCDGTPECNLAALHQVIAEALAMSNQGVATEAIMADEFLAMRRDDPIWERTEKIERRYEEEACCGVGRRQSHVVWSPKADVTVTEHIGKNPKDSPWLSYTSNLAVALRFAVAKAKPGDLRILAAVKPTEVATFNLVQELSSGDPPSFKVIDSAVLMRKWTFDGFFKKPGAQFRHSHFKVGKDDDGSTIRLRADFFEEYMKTQKDDSPVYLFDNHFKHEKKELLSDYRIPHYFPDDFMALADEDRPPYRWIGIGPKRSGTVMHQDPLCTSAWNTLIRGRKLWLLLPPSTPKRVAKSKDVMLPDDDDEACNHFLDLLPRKRARQDPDFHPLLCVQYPG
ncbi:PSR, partial [Symbiodinium microadriaticum]